MADAMFRIVQSQAYAKGLRLCIPMGQEANGVQNHLTTLDSG